MFPHLPAPTDNHSIFFLQLLLSFQSSSINLFSPISSLIPSAQVSLGLPRFLPGWIRTRNPRKRLIADPRPRPLGHWDQQLYRISEIRFGLLSRNGEGCVVLYWGQVQVHLYPHPATALGGGLMVNSTPRILISGREAWCPFAGEWVDLGAGVDVCGKSRPYRCSKSGPSNP
jgi:hypothetical protein